jgi:hypothetical protein
MTEWSYGPSEELTFVSQTLTFLLSTTNKKQANTQEILLKESRGKSEELPKWKIFL